MDGKEAQLLEAKAGNVSEVSYLAGFQNLPHFSKVFKEHFGVSPSEYKTYSPLEPH